MPKRPSLIIISGPTGVGKTEIAVALAESLGADIISADAMQVYRHMDIGTAKASREQRARVRHHLIDVVDPDEPFSAADFESMAGETVRDLYQEGRPIFVVGGTGFYIKALTRGLFPSLSQDGELRKRLRSEAETMGKEVLYQRLRQVDPAAAEAIHPNDAYRILRALEVYQITGRPISQHQEAHGFQRVRYRILPIGLTLERNILYDRINRRVDGMVASGFLEEVRWLLDQGYPSSLKSMRSIGYRHMGDHLEGRVTWDETIRLLKRDTRRYAKRQLTWFKADPEIHWLEPGQIDDLWRTIDSFLAGGA